MSTINDRTTRVQAMLGGRSDLVSNPPVASDRIVGWLKDAYTELGMGYTFEEMEDSIDDQFISPVDTYDYPATVRAIKGLTLVKSDGTTWPVVRRNVKVIDRFSSTTNVGPPRIYASFSKQIIVRPVPDDTYAFIWRAWLKPAFTADVVSTTLLLPDDWLEILDYSAVLRGHTELLERDKAAEVFKILFGGYDPGTGKPIPGLIKQRQTTQFAEYEDQEYGITPRVRRYTNTI